MNAALYGHYGRLLAAVLATGLALTGCGESPAGSTLTLTLKPAEFVFSIPAKGELISAKEVSINAPSGNRGQLTLAWLAEENSRVQSGDVVARFDGTAHQLDEQRAQLELEKNQLTRNVTEREQELSQFAIHRQAGEVEQEKDMIEKFSIEDLAVYSKNEIIDQLLSKDYLTAQQAYLAWRQASQQTQGDAQLYLLNLQGKNFQDTIELSQGALANLEVKAPVGGILIHAKNWRGEKVREGQSLWPGSKLASIPSLEKLQAKLYVLENEAAGVRLGQNVKIRLDAYPDRVLSGAVAGVANIAAPRNTRSPTKYFEVTVELDESDPGFMRPGQKLDATVVVASKQDALTIPNQAIFKDEKDTWVFVRKRGGFERRSIETGLRSLTQTEVAEGLSAGEEVALLQPPGASSQ